MYFKIFSMFLLLALSAPNVFANSLRDAFDHYKRNPGGSFSNDEMRGWVGPSFHARNNLVDPRLVTARMPSWNAGCGGIDFFSGSFSIVTKDELVQMARGIAAGAPGYFFNLAMASVCPNCAEQMAALQQKLEKWNQLTMDSCNRSWDFVESQTNWIKSQKDKGGILGTEKDVFSGLIPDYADTMAKLSTKTSPSKNEAESTESNNLAEHAKDKIQTNPLSEYLAELKTEEMYMSIFGTSVMRSELQGDGTYAIDSENIAPTFDFKKAFYNRADQTITVIKCALPPDQDPKCLKTEEKELVFEGIVVKNTRLINGKSNTPEDKGILTKMMDNVPFTPEQESFINNTRYSYRQILSEFQQHQNLIPTAGEVLALMVAKESMTQFYQDLKNKLLIVTSSSTQGLTPSQQALIEKSIANADIRFAEAIDDVDRQIANMRSTAQLQAALKTLVSN